MKTRIDLLRRLALSCAILCPGLFLGAALEERWESLFNGKDLSGWVPMHDATFAVEDGNLRLSKGMGWLRSEKQYKDFVLELEWRALKPSYDSGIFVRAGLEGQPWPNEGWQINLSSDALGGLVKGSTPVVPAKTRRAKAGQWVKFRIEVKGKRIALDVNDKRAWECDVLDAERGYIGIQAEEHSFDFRSIRIQDLGGAGYSRTCTSNTSRISRVALISRTTFLTGE
jgi:hypothetical protein